MTTRAVTYARVSGDDRGKEGRNLEGQLEMCRNYAQEHGYEIVAELAEDDRGASGAEIDLPQLTLVRNMAANGEFDVLVVREIDRLSRKLAKQLVVEQELKRTGVQVEYVIGEYPDTPEGDFQKHVKAAVAEYEREKIKERMVRGRRQKVKAGHVLVHGRPPYGYQQGEVDGKQTLEIHEPEARIVKMIFQLYTTGNGEGPLSQRAITQRLTDMGIPTPGDEDARIYKERGRGQWNRTTVRKILKRETYVGRWHYGKVKRSNGGADVRNDQDHWLTVGVPAIIDQATFDDAQEQLTANKRNAPGNTKHEYLLGRRSKCGRCGKAIWSKCIKNHGREYLYYSCACAANIACYAQECDQHKWFRVDEVDALVWDWLVEQFSDPDELRETLDNVRQKRAGETEPLQRELETVNDLLKENRNKLQRALDLYIGNEFPRDWLNERTVTLRRTIDSLERQRRSLEDRLDERTVTNDQADEIMAISREIAAGLEEARGHFDKQRQLIELLDLHAEFDIVDGDKTVRIECKIVLEPQVLSVEGKPM